MYILKDYYIYFLALIYCNSYDELRLYIIISIDIID